MILPHPLAPLGSVTHLPSYHPALFEPSHVILCRNTAPLVTFAFGLIGKGVGCKILGREIGTGLVTLIKSCKCSDLKELEQKLIQRRTREVSRARARESESSVAAIEDKYDCLNIFLQHADSVEELCAEILELFDESRKGLLTLSTIHKAKGLEWETVFALDFNLLPSRWAKQPWQQQQEKNLQYVCVTRAKLNLFFITSGCWRKEGETIIHPTVVGTWSSDTASIQTIPRSSPTFNPDAVDDRQSYLLDKFRGDELRAQEIAREEVQLSNDQSADEEPHDN